MSLSSDESACKYVCSRGLLKSCDIWPQNPHSSARSLYPYNWAELPTNSIVYIHGSAMPAFIRGALPHITVSFVLVSGDCDETITSDIFKSDSELHKFMEDSRLIHWYSQNAAIQHPKLTIIPIGMCYHAIIMGGNWKHGEVTPTEYERTLIDIAKEVESKPKKVKCYGTFHFQMWTRYANDRKDAIQQIPTECIDYEENRIDTYETWKNQTKYEFVVSPHGNGYDCHRTWEALSLGIIPIVKTSPIDPLFDDLPVLIVKEWSDITPEFLQNKLNEINHKKKSGEYKMERLTLAYWVNKFAESLQRTN